jgi:RsmE family RNA methyltransferase
MGVKRIAFYHSQRVEKSFWHSRALEPEALGEQLRLGLEQARDTRLPRVELARRLRPFAERMLGELAAGGSIWLGDLGAPPPPHEAPSLVLLGPEGGLLEPEITLLEAAGARRVGLGVRALRVETAAVALLGIAADRLGYTARP